MKRICAICCKYCVHLSDKSTCQTKLCLQTFLSLSRITATSLKIDPAMSLPLSSNSVFLERRYLEIFQLGLLLNNVFSPLFSSLLDHYVKWTVPSWFQCSTLNVQLSMVQQAKGHITFTTENIFWTISSLALSRTSLLSLKTLQEILYFYAIKSPLLSPISSWHTAATSRCNFWWVSANNCISWLLGSDCFG